MDLEELTQKLTQIFPRPLLVVVLILAAIIVMMILNPPHTICDTAMETLSENQKGILFPTQVGKRTFPGRIQSAMESCRLGDSSGACYEYLSILRKVAMSIKNAPGECVAPMMGVDIPSYLKTEVYEQVRDGDRIREELADVRYRGSTLGRVLEDGIDLLVRKAWGTQPPEPGPFRFGWLQESEMAVFCHLQDVLRRAKAPEEWAAFQKAIYAKLPGEVPPEVPAGAVAPTPRPATMTFPETEIRKRTIFSANCSAYR